MLKPLKLLKIQMELRWSNKKNDDELELELKLMIALSISGTQAIITQVTTKYLAYLLPLKTDNSLDEIPFKNVN